MNERIKQLWITELRSGNWVQAKEYLRKLDDSHCCLGVLCRIYEQENPDKILWEKPAFGFESDHYTVRTNGTNYPDSALLPLVVSKWAGIENGHDEDGANAVDDVYIQLDGRDTTLSALNDQGLSFEEIANIIESRV